MAIRKTKKRAPKASFKPSTDAELARRAANARRKAEASRTAADLAHKEGEKAHVEAEAVHEEVKRVHAKVRSVEKEIRHGAESPTGIARPTKTGAKPPLESEQRGSPLMPATYGGPAESKLPFSVVGIGASAGGYEAYTSFLANLPRETGMAYVLIQHLDPSHPSHLGELLGKVTQVPVNEIRNGTEVRPDHIYVLPSNATVTLEKGRFKLSARPPMRGISMPVDIFFRSLAMEQQNRAIGIILSGSGTDGTLGLGEIKGQGGITFAQDQGTSKHFGMPGSAISAGSVDFVMTPEEIAKELSRLSGHPYVAPKKRGEARRPAPQEVENAESLFFTGGEDLRTLFMLLRTRTSVDFSLYKPGTLNRRIMRRMALHKIDTIRNYIKFLQESPTEVDALFNDLLISVTGFFRDPGSFHALQKKILPRLTRDRKRDAPLRIWSCGCSTGEEAYSLAMAVSEFLEKNKIDMPVQIFASDLNERGIEKARAGVYHENILLDVSRERLRRFFSKVDGFYQVNKSIRDLCVFARQNVVMDPPFSNLDVISCRNVLIYLTPVLQKRVVPVFHYALKPHGFLLLGSSETISESSEFFALVDRKHKFYAKKSTAYRSKVDLGRIRTTYELPPAPPKRTGAKEEGGLANLEEKVDRLILTRYSPRGLDQCPDGRSAIPRPDSALHRTPTGGCQPEFTQNGPRRARPGRAPGGQQGNPEGRTRRTAGHPNSFAPRAGVGRHHRSPPDDDAFRPRAFLPCPVPGGTVHAGGSRGTPKGKLRRAETSRNRPVDQIAQ